MLTLRFYAETDTFPSKSICFGIKVLYFGEDLKNTILFYSFDYCYGSCFI